MAKKLLALCGSGRGPKVSIQGLSEPRVSVCKLAAGGHVVVKLESGETLMLEGDGEFPIPAGSIVQLEAHLAGRWLMCHILAA